MTPARALLLAVLLTLPLTGCRLDNPVDAEPREEAVDLVEANERLSGTVSLGSARVLVVENPHGAVVVEGETLQPRARWFLYRVALAPSPARAQAALPSLYLNFTTAGDTAYATIVAPPPTDTLSFGSLVSLGVPYDIEVDIRTARSEVFVRYLDGDVRVSADTTVELTGHRGGCDLRSAQGPLRLELDLRATATCLAAADRGDVAAEIPATTSATVTLATDAGTVSADGFAFTSVGEQTPQRLRATLGDGEATLQLTTGSGDVQLEAQQ